MNDDNKFPIFPNLSSSDKRGTFEDVQRHFKFITEMIKYYKNNNDHKQVDLIRKQFEHIFKQVGMDINVT